MSPSVPVCTHSHLLRERLFHRGPWNDDPVKRVVDLCAECRAAFRAADIGLFTADGKRWRELTRESPLPLRAPQQPGADAVQSTERAAPTPTSAVVVEVGASPVVEEMEMPVADAACSDCFKVLPLKAHGRCGPCYNRWYRKNMRGKPKDRRPVAPDVEAKAAEIEAERGALADAYADAKAALLEVRQTLAPVLGLQEAEESAAVMATRVSVLVAQLQAEANVPVSSVAKEAAGEPKAPVEASRPGILWAVSRVLAPLLEGADAPMDPLQLADKVAARFTDLKASNGHDLAAKLEAENDQLRSRLRAWDLWLKEWQSGQSPALLLSTLLRVARGELA